VTVQVLVARKTIPQGTSGAVLAKSTSFYEVASVPKAQVESGAITDSATLAGSVALAEIPPNAQLTASQFGPSTGVVGQLGPGERAVVISLGAPQAVDGQISAGSVVDFWVTTSGQGAGGVSRPVAKLLFQKMTVLGVNGGNITLEAATPKQAGQIIFASTNTQVWLALRNQVSANMSTPPTVSASNVTGG